MLRERSPERIENAEAAISIGPLESGRYDIAPVEDSHSGNRLLWKRASARRSMVWKSVPFLIVAAAVCGCGSAPSERRAIAYLAVEVPRWSAENGCFSCHNDGDGARALFAAARQGLRVSPASTAVSGRWLSRPEDWETNRGDPAFSDKKLARLQFAAALVAKLELEPRADRSALQHAARLVAADQGADGSWRFGDGGAEEPAIGSPATYGAPLGTALALRVLRSEDAAAFGVAIANAERWLSGIAIDNVPASAAVLLGLDRPGEAALVERRRDAAARLLGAQGSEGGWGPYPDAPAEAFDTALALLALASLEDRAPAAPAIRRGRGFLIALQNEDGSWPETTRPTGGVSYAQRVSTAAWAALALLATRGSGE